MKRASALELEKLLGSRDSETYGIYIGFQQIADCIGPTKIGRTINVRALQRGRSQGGADWWFYAFWPLRSREETYSVEAELKKSLIAYKSKGNQNQQELYALSLDAAEALVSKTLGVSVL